MDHVALTIDGIVDSRPGEMRWMPPEQAATVRAAEEAANRLDRPKARSTPVSRSAR